MGEQQQASLYAAQPLYEFWDSADEQSDAGPSDTPSFTVPSVDVSVPPTNSPPTVFHSNASHGLNLNLLALSPAEETAARTPFYEDSYSYEEGAIEDAWAWDSWRNWGLLGVLTVATVGAVVLRRRAKRHQYDAV